MTENHLHFRLAHELQRRRARAQQTLGRRLDQALLRCRLLSGANAASLDRISTGKSLGSPPPPSDNRLEGEGYVLEAYLRRFRLMVEALEREVDAHELRPIEADLAKETMEEKEHRLLRDYEGIPSYEVCVLDHTFGSPRTVERTRVKLGVRPSDGKALSTMSNGKAS